MVSYRVIPFIVRTNIIGAHFRAQGAVAQAAVMPFNFGKAVFYKGEQLTLFCMRAGTAYRCSLPGCAFGYFAIIEVVSPAAEYVFDAVGHATLLKKYFLQSKFLVLFFV
jgi:hypothetical protein